MAPPINSKMILISLDRYEELTKNSKLFRRENECVELSEDDILTFISSESVHKAKLVLRHMKLNDITWDKCGRLVLDDECVTTSNVIEIINDVVNSNKSHIVSPASKHFYKLLMLTKFPISLLDNNHNGRTDSEGKEDIDEGLL